MATSLNGEQLGEFTMKLNSLLSEKEKLPQDYNEWDQNQKQKYHSKLVELMIKLRSTSFPNNAQDFFDNLPYVTNKEIIVSIAKLLSKKHNILTRREHMRVKACTIAFLNQYWRLFQEDLKTLKIERIYNDDSKHSLSHYKITLNGKTYETNKKGKILNLFQNKRSPKCNMVEDIQNFEKIIIPVVNSVQNGINQSLSMESISTEQSSPEIDHNQSQFDLNLEDFDDFPNFEFVPDDIEF